MGKIKINLERNSMHARSTIYFESEASTLITTQVLYLPCDYTHHSSQSLYGTLGTVSVVVEDDTTKTQHTDGD